MTPLVVGLDLSLTSTGICMPDGTQLRVKTRAKDGDLRLLYIRDALRYALLDKPTLAVVEDLPRHAMGAGVTAMVHGVARAELADQGIPYALIVPATLKAYACDNGRATKADLSAAAYLHAGIEFTDDPGGDKCDAWWLRQAGLDWLGAPEIALPQAQRDRLTKANWPVTQ